jgi:hypothetical protein
LERTAITTLTLFVAGPAGDVQGALALEVMAA